MNKFIDLELKRIPLKPYIVTTGIITISVLVFTYLLAVVFKFGDDANLDLFNNYSNIIMNISLLNSLCFAILSAVMYAKYVIEEYTGKGVILLFSYPVNRSKVLLAKILIVSAFIFVSATASNLIVFGVFFGAEQLFPLINDFVTLGIVLKTILVSISFALIAGGVGIMSMRIGFAKKSSITAIVAALIIMSIVSQIFSATLGSNIIPIIFALIFVIISIFVLSGLFAKVSKMEVA